MRWAMSDDYCEEVGDVSIIPVGSRSESGTLIGSGPGLCGLPRTLLPGTPVNRGQRQIHREFIAVC
jgi:hypothetical protein